MDLKAESRLLYDLKDESKKTKQHHQTNYKFNVTSHKQRNSNPIPRNE